MKLFDKFLYIILYIISFIIIGIASVIQPGAGFKPLDWTVVLDNILTYMAIICIILATLLAVVDKFKNTNSEYIDADNEIKEFASSKSYVPSILSKYFSFVNPKRKLKQHEFNIKKQLTKLEAKGKEKDFNVWNYGTNEDKAKNKYCIKRKQLEYKLSEEWEEHNLKYFNIKYDKITSNILLSGIYENNISASPNDFITKNKSAKVAREKLPQLLLSFGLTTFTSMLIFNIIFNSTALLSILVKTGTLLWNTFMTIRYANNWTNNVTLKDIRWRRGIITEYNKWIEQEAKKAVLNKQNNTTVREDECTITNEIKNNLLTEGIEKEKLNV